MTDLLLRAIFTDNLALSYFLGMCTFWPYHAVSTLLSGWGWR